MRKSDDARWITLFIFLVIFCSVSVIFCNIGFAQPENKILKVAVLDSPNMPRKLSLWKRYKQAYLAGIETAVLAAKEQGITLEYKTFFYGEKPLDILKKIKLVQAWHPDVILGPHYSNQLFLLKDYFSDTLVLSSYASDSSIKELPNNFYSIFPSDNDLMEVIMNFIQQRFGQKNILMLVQADCKECTNMAANFAPSYSKRNANLSITTVSRSDFIGENVNDLSLPQLTRSYQKNDIILIFTSNYYLYEMLLGRLVNFIKMPNVIFITDVDDWGLQDVNIDSAITETLLNYQAYRVTPLFSSLSSTGNELLEFNRLFLKRYKKSTADSVSYVTFLTIKSVLAALEKFPSKNTNWPVSKQVMTSYEEALQNTPNWYRSNKYAVYQFTGKKEVLVDKVVLTKSTSHS
jgi:hypothetical protein